MSSSSWALVDDSIEAEEYELAKTMILAEIAHTLIDILKELKKER